MSSTSIVHVKPFDTAQQVLCNRTGQAFPHLREVGDYYPVTCHACRKALEMISRTELSKLSAEGMMKVLELIGSMRNGDLTE